MFLSLSEVAHQAEFVVVALGALVVSILESVLVFPTPGAFDLGGQNKVKDFLVVIMFFLFSLSCHSCVKALTSPWCKGLACGVCEEPPGLQKHSAACFLRSAFDSVILGQP